MSYKILSIDCGVRNLSMAVLSMRLPDPRGKRCRTLDTLETKACDGYVAPWQDCRLLHWENIDILVDNEEDHTQNCNLVTISAWIPLLHHTLRSRLHIYDDVDTVLIENQPNFGREKIKMISILIHAFFTQHFHGRDPQPIVAMASAQMKLQVLVDPRNFYQILKKPRKFAGEEEGDKKTKNLIDLFGVSPAKKDLKKKQQKSYKERKQRAVYLANAVIQLIDIPAYLVDRFSRTNKQDDFADALLQGLSHLQRCPAARK